MPKLIIDKKEIEFTAGETVLQAAKNAGIDIPHFCWHPGLSISGNCRICLVEIEKLPKLAIACSTIAMEGMEVHTKSEKVINAQNAVMEFLLINHPLDCPICDEAGECKLQDYAYKYSTGTSRFDEEKNHKDKRVPLGPNVLFDAERCISCSRCIRFCEEIAKEPQLTFVQRGEKVTIKTFPGKELDNPYSMNVIEICPVGALTSRHFRFRSRVWDMSFTDSICPGCSRGCNTIIGVRQNVILRIEPRFNPNVNEWWLCDWGRLETIKTINDETLRLNSPKIKSGKISDGEKGLVEVGWEEAEAKTVSELSDRSKEIFFFASPFSTLEDNYMLKKFANEVFGNDNIAYIPNIEESFGDNILRKSDKTPNSRGLEMLGIKQITNEQINNIRAGKYSIVYVINDDISRLDGSPDLFKDIKTFIFHSSIRRDFICSNAVIVFPEATYAEINGTFINFSGRIQRIKPAVSTLEQERILGEFSMSRLDKFGAHNDRWAKETRFNARPTWKILKQISGAFGKQYAFENSEEVFTELCKVHFGLEGMDYEKIGEQGYILK